MSYIDTFWLIENEKQTLTSPLKGFAESMQFIDLVSPSTGMDQNVCYSAITTP